MEPCTQQHCDGSTFNVVPATIAREDQRMLDCPGIPIKNDIQSAPKTPGLKSHNPFLILFRIFETMENLKSRWEPWTMEPPKSNHNMSRVH